MEFAIIKLAIDMNSLTNIKFSPPPNTFQKNANCQHSSPKISHKKEQSIISYRCSSRYPLSCAFACSSSAFNTFEWALTTSSSVNVRSGSS